MSNDKMDKILADIKKTGFVAELNTASLFIKHSWIVNHNSSYIDKDQEKSREIDVTVRKFDFEAKFRLRQEFYAAVEIKSSERPWVVFTSPQTDDSFNSQAWSNLFSVENLLLYRHLSRTEIHTEFMRAARQRIGTAFHESFKSPNQPSQIFEAVISTCKAVSFMKDSFEEISEIDSNANLSYNPKEYHFLRIFIPLVVLDGELYEAYLDENGEITLEEKDYIPLKFSYSSPKYARRSSLLNSEPLNYMTYFPDVVTYKGLNSYIDKLDNWREVVFNDLQLQLQLDNDEWFADAD